MKRWVRFKWIMNTEWKIDYRKALEKRRFIPVEFRNQEVVKTIIVNRDNILRTIEGRKDAPK